MKGCVLWVLVLVSAAGMVFMFLSFSKTGKTALFPGFNSAHYKDDATVVASSRKLKEITQPSRNMKRGSKSVNLDDYLPIDPAPSSKASVEPGPIQHGTPLMPFIPNTNPPPHPPN